MPIFLAKIAITGNHCFFSSLTSAQNYSLLSLLILLKESYLSGINYTPGWDDEKPSLPEY